MKCPNCGGKGKYKNGFGKVGSCYYCLGTGKVNDKGEQVKTEQEWLQTATTEQLAEWILDVSDECFDCGKSDNGDCPFGKAQGVCTCINKDSVVEWLKQPHKE